MPEKMKTRIPGTILPNVVPIMGTIEVSGGAITTQTGDRDSGVTFQRQATGDYRGTIHKGYKRVVAAEAHLVHPTSGTAVALTTGNFAQVQGITAANMNGTTPCSSFSVSVARLDTGALIDPANGMFISWTLWVQER